jgi:hypothetical protein
LFGDDGEYSSSGGAKMKEYETWNSQLYILIGWIFEDFFYFNGLSFDTKRLWFNNPQIDVE